MSGLFTHDLHDKSLWRRIDSTSKLEGRGVQRVCLRRAAERERRRNGAQVARKKGRSAPQMLAINKSLMGADIAVPRSRDSCFLRCSPTEIIDADDKKPRHGRKTFRSPSSSSSFTSLPPSTLLQHIQDASPQKEPRRFHSRSPTSSYIRVGESSRFSRED